MKWRPKKCLFFTFFGKMAETRNLFIYLISRHYISSQIQLPGSQIFKRNPKMLKIDEMAAKKVSIFYIFLAFLNKMATTWHLIIYQYAQCFVLPIKTGLQMTKLLLELEYLKKQPRNDQFSQAILEKNHQAYISMLSSIYRIEGERSFEGIWIACIRGGKGGLNSLLYQ